MNKQTLSKLQQTELEIMRFVCNFCEENGITYYLIGGTLLGAVRHNGFIPWDDDIDIAMPRADFERFQAIFKDPDDYELDYFHTDKHYYLPFAKVRAKGTKCVQMNQQNYLGKQGIWIDVFPLDNASRFRIVDKIRFAAVNSLKRAIQKKMGVSIGSSINLKGRIFFRLAPKLPKSFLVSLQHIIMVGGSNKSKYLVNLCSPYGVNRERHLRSWFAPAQKCPFCGQLYPVPHNYKKVLTNVYGSSYMTPPPEKDRVTHDLYEIKFK